MNHEMSDILIVDDEIPNLQLLSELLGKEGYQVRPTGRPQLAIESALANVIMISPKSDITVSAIDVKFGAPPKYFDLLFIS
jgi:CheY-like chemotaxis protein